ncbi:hypothetical protein [Gymnodinialimonas ulvae]|uniref:hypothetical protein n=1 Tax=Gymnodinialimonas ulvae TaxID=3126504 RepID=UPI0030A88C88
MGAVEVEAALAALDAEMASPAPDAAAVSAAFGALENHRRPRYPEVHPFNEVMFTGEQIRGIFAHCYGVLDRWPDYPGGDENRDVWRLRWQVKTLIEGFFVDPHGDSRAFRQGSLDHVSAFNRPLPDYVSDPHSPLPHFPLDLEEARALALPYLQMLEARLDDAPLSHLPLCWSVKEHPAAPFDVIFNDWIADIDALGLGLGNTGEALRRGFALASLAQSGRQKVSRKAMDHEILPQFDDPHPLIAGCAGRFVGRVYKDTKRSFNNGTPQPLANILDHIGALATNRRAVAGGFLHGLDDFGNNVFVDLKKDPRLEGYDVDGWVMRIFADPVPEVHLPGAQGFWFPVHEHYCLDPPFVDKMIDAGLTWEALLCATEMQEPVDGMAAVLQRLAEVEDRGIADPARNCLERVYKT